MTENRLADNLMRAWMKRDWLTCLAWPMAQLFGVLIHLRRIAYQYGICKQQKLPVPVIVVGNIFIGGTGKTPFTIWLLQQLKNAGYSPGVISRGYGSKQDAPRIVQADSKTTQVGDEPVLLALRSACPVVVGRERAEAGRVLLASFPDVNVIIADDGLQHLALARDVEIMIFDSRGAGNGWLLPAGPLREPLTRKRDITVANLNKGEMISADLPSDTIRMQLNGTSAWQLCKPDMKRELSSFDTGLSTLAAAGIGNPERFFAMLRQQGMQFAALPLPDHFSFSPNPFAKLTPDLIFVTEKDAVKCGQLAEIANDPRIWVVAVEAEIETGLIEKILKKLM